MTDLTDEDVDEAKYRFEKTYRMVDCGAEYNAKAAILQGYVALGGDVEDIIEPSDGGGMDDDYNIDGYPHDTPLSEVVGKEIVDVEYTGDYYHPFTLVLEDGTEIMSGGVINQ